MSPDAYWLFLESEDSTIPDITCDWNWTMKTVRHLLEWMCSYTKREKFRLVIKRRIWSIRYLNGI